MPKRSTVWRVLGYCAWGMAFVSFFTDVVGALACIGIALGCENRADLDAKEGF